MLDLIAKAGPRALTRDVPVDVRKEVFKSRSFHNMLDWAARLTAQRFRKRDALVAAVAKDNYETERKAVNGLGEHQARIPAEIVAEMQAKYGFDCWGDDEFIAAFLRDNPQFKVRVTHGTKGQLYVPGR